jgi:hypothetical protein
VRRRARVSAHGLDLQDVWKLESEVKLIDLSTIPGFTSTASKA